MADTTILIEELVICRYYGWKYPTADRENELFKQLLCYEPRSFQVRNAFLVIENGSVVMHDEVGHLIDSQSSFRASYYPYFVENIEPQKRSDSTYSDAHTAVDATYVTSNKHTIVILSGTSSRRLFIPAIVADLVHHCCQQAFMGDAMRGVQQRVNPPVTFVSIGRGSLSDVSYVATRQQLITHRREYNYQHMHSEMQNDVMRQLLNVLLPMMTIPSALGQAEGNIEYESEALEAASEPSVAAVASEVASLLLDQLRCPVLINAGPESCAAAHGEFMHGYDEQSLPCFLVS